MKARPIGGDKILTMWATYTMFSSLKITGTSNLFFLSGIYVVVVAVFKQLKRKPNNTNLTKIIILFHALHNAQDVPKYQEFQ